MELLDVSNKSGRDQVKSDGDDRGLINEYPLMLNPRTARQRENQPHWAHSREALMEKLAALVVESASG